MQTILSRGRLIAAVHQDFQPFSTAADDGQRVGFDIDLTREFARRWLGDPNAIEFVTGEPTEQVNRLFAGTVDLVAAALVEQRDWAESIDFSQTYLGPRRFAAINDWVAPKRRTVSRTGQCYPPGNANRWYLWRHLPSLVRRHR
ncbi:MAG: transporter substrate-binding domain-containing protein [Caldilineaceae bacterium]